MTFLRKVFDKLKEIDSYKISYLDFLLVGATSGILSLIIISGPLALIINLMILITNLRIFLSFVLAFIGGIFFYLVTYFYSNSVTKGKVDNIKIVSLFFGINVFIFGIILIVVLIMIGVY